MFSVRIVTTDHHLAKPIRGLDVCYNEFLGSDVNRVPVFRIYGSTPAGQKTCMHIHGVFPYLYVLYDGTAPVERYTRQFARSLDQALNVASGRTKNPVQHVYKVSLVSGIPFYGFHEDEKQFLKIYLFNPQMIRKAADLLLGGAVMNKIFQPYESHIPYQLQLFIDYNLYGMNMVSVAAVKFRRPGRDWEGPIVVEDAAEGSPDDLCGLSALDDSAQWNVINQRRWNMANIPDELLLDMEIERESTCELEVDVVAADILNRMEVGANLGTNPGLAALWEDERQRRRERGDSSQLTPPSSPDRGEMPWTEAEARLQEQLRNIIRELQPDLEESLSDDQEMAAPESQDIDLIPASQVAHHTPSDREDSQDTVIFDDEDEEVHPIVDRASILKVVSSGHSFLLDNKDSQPMGSQEKSLAQMLAELAEDDSPTPSQMASQVASQVAALEEQDSILGGTPTAEDGEDRASTEAEEHEMSQEIIWDSPEAGNREAEDQQFDMQGMDSSWNSSQWVDLTRGDEGTAGPDADAARDEEGNSDEDLIPQFDGAADEQQGATPTTHPKKRLGMRGPVSSPSGSNPAADGNQATAAEGQDKSKLKPKERERENIFSSLISSMPNSEFVFKDDGTNEEQKKNGTSATNAHEKENKKKKGAKGSPEPKKQSSQIKKCHDELIKEFHFTSDVTGGIKNKSKYPVMLTEEFECGGMPNLPENEIGQFYKERPGVRYQTYCSIYRQAFPRSDVDTKKEEMELKVAEHKKTYVKTVPKPVKKQEPATEQEAPLEPLWKHDRDFLPETPGTVGATPPKQRKKQKASLEHEPQLFEDLDEIPKLKSREKKKQARTPFSEDYSRSKKGEKLPTELKVVEAKPQNSELEKERKKSDTISEQNSAQAQTSSKQKVQKTIEQQTQTQTNDKDSEANLDLGGHIKSEKEAASAAIPPMVESIKKIHEEKHKAFSPLKFKVHAQYSQGRNIADEPDAIYKGKVRVKKKDIKDYGLKHKIGFEKVILENLNILLSVSDSSMEIGEEEQRKLETVTREQKLAPPISFEGKRFYGFKGPPSSFPKSKRKEPKKKTSEKKAKVQKTSVRKESEDLFDSSTASDTSVKVETQKQVELEDSFDDNQVSHEVILLTFEQTQESPTKEHSAKEAAASSETGGDLALQAPSSLSSEMVRHISDSMRKQAMEEAPPTLEKMEVEEPSKQKPPEDSKPQVAQKQAEEDKPGKPETVKRGRGRPKIHRGPKSTQDKQTRENKEEQKGKVDKHQARQEVAQKQKMEKGSDKQETVHKMDMDVEREKVKGGSKTEMHKASAAAPKTGEKSAQEPASKPTTTEEVSSGSSAVAKPESGKRGRGRPPKVRGPKSYREQQMKKHLAEKMVAKTEKEEEGIADVSIDSTLSDSNTPSKTPIDQSRKPTEKTAFVRSESTESTTDDDNAFRKPSKDGEDSEVSLASSGTTEGSSGSKQSRKRRKHEQMDHYRFRSKRVAVDYSPHAFSHMFNIERLQQFPYFGQLPTEDAHLIYRKGKQLAAERQSAPQVQKSVEIKRELVVLVEKLHLRSKTVKLVELLEQFPWMRTRIKLAHEVLYSASEESSDVSFISDQGSDVSKRSSGENRVPKPHKKDSYNKRLGSAFLKTGKHRKKKKNKEKILTALSDLHNAIVEKKETYAEKVATDHDKEYSDSMFNMSYMSPKVPSDKGSPPQAKSPSEHRDQDVEAGNEKDSSDTADREVEADKAADAVVNGDTRSSPVLYAVKEAVVKFKSSSAKEASDKAQAKGKVDHSPARLIPGNRISPARSPQRPSPARSSHDRSPARGSPGHSRSPARSGQEDNDSESGRISPPHLGLPAFMERPEGNYMTPPELSRIETPVHMKDQGLPDLEPSMPSLGKEQESVPRLVLEAESSAEKKSKDLSRKSEMSDSDGQMREGKRKRGRPSKQEKVSSSHVETPKIETIVKTRHGKSARKSTSPYKRIPVVPEEQLFAPDIVQVVTTRKPINQEKKASESKKDVVEKPKSDESKLPNALGLIKKGEANSSPKPAAVTSPGRRSVRLVVNSKIGKPSTYYRSPEMERSASVVPSEQQGKTDQSPIVESSRKPGSPKVSGDEGRHSIKSTRSEENRTQRHSSRSDEVSTRRRSSQRDEVTNKQDTKKADESSSRRHPRDRLSLKGRTRRQEEMGKKKKAEEEIPKETPDSPPSMEAAEVASSKTTCSVIPASPDAEDEEISMVQMGRRRPVRVIESEIPASPVGEPASPDADLYGSSKAEPMKCIPTSPTQESDSSGIILSGKVTFLTTDSGPSSPDAEHRSAFSKPLKEIPLAGASDEDSDMLSATPEPFKDIKGSAETPRSPQADQRGPTSMKSIPVEIPTEEVEGPDSPVQRELSQSPGQKTISLLTQMATEIPEDMIPRSHKVGRTKQASVGPASPSHDDKQTLAQGFKVIPTEMGSEDEGGPASPDTPSRGKGKKPAQVREIPVIASETVLSPSEETSVSDMVKYKRKPGRLSEEGPRSPEGAGERAGRTRKAPAMIPLEEEEDVTPASPEMPHPGASTVKSVSIPSEPIEHTAQDSAPDIVSEAEATIRMLDQLSGTLPQTRLQAPMSPDIMDGPDPLADVPPSKPKVIALEEAPSSPELALPEPKAVKTVPTEIPVEEMESSKDGEEEETPASPVYQEAQTEAVKAIPSHIEDAGPISPEIEVSKTGNDLQEQAAPETSTVKQLSTRVPPQEIPTEHTSPASPQMEMTEPITVKSIPQTVPNDPASPADHMLAEGVNIIPSDQGPVSPELTVPSVTVPEAIPAIPSDINEPASPEVPMQNVVRVIPSESIPMSLDQDVYTGEPVKVIPGDIQPASPEGVSVRDYHGPQSPDVTTGMVESVKVIPGEIGPQSPVAVVQESREVPQIPSELGPGSPELEVPVTGKGRELSVEEAPMSPELEVPSRQAMKIIPSETAAEPGSPELVDTVVPASPEVSSPVRGTPPKVIQAKEAKDDSAMAVIHTDLVEPSDLHQNETHKDDRQLEPSREIKSPTEPVSQMDEERQERVVIKAPVIAIPMEVQEGDLSDISPSKSEVVLKVISVDTYGEQSLTSGQVERSEKESPNEPDVREGQIVKDGCKATYQSAATSTMAGPASPSGPASPTSDEDGNRPESTYIPLDVTDMRSERTDPRLRETTIAGDSNSEKTIPGSVILDSSSKSSSSYLADTKGKGTHTGAPRASDQPSGIDSPISPVLSAKIRGKQSRSKVRGEPKHIPLDSPAPDTLKDPRLQHIRGTCDCGKETPDDKDESVSRDKSIEKAAECTNLNIIPSCSVGVNEVGEPPGMKALKTSGIREIKMDTDPTVKLSVSSSIAMQSAQGSAFSVVTEESPASPVSARTELFKSVEDEPGSSRSRENRTKVTAEEPSSPDDKDTATARAEMSIPSYIVDYPMSPEQEPTGSDTLSLPPGSTASSVPSKFGSTVQHLKSATVIPSSPPPQETALDMRVREIPAEPSVMKEIPAEPTAEGPASPRMESLSQLQGPESPQMSLQCGQVAREIPQDPLVTDSPLLEDPSSPPVSLQTAQVIRQIPQEPQDAGSFPLQAPESPQVSLSSGQAMREIPQEPLDTESSPLEPESPPMSLQCGQVAREIPQEAIMEDEKEISQSLSIEAPDSPGVDSSLPATRIIPTSPEGIDEPASPKLDAAQSSLSQPQSHGVPEVKAIPSELVEDEGPSSPGGPSSPIMHQGSPLGSNVRSIPSETVMEEQDDNPASPDTGVVLTSHGSGIRQIPADAMETGPALPTDQGLPPAGGTAVEIPRESSKAQSVVTTSEGPMSPGDAPASPPSGQTPKPIPDASVIPEYAEERPMSPGETPASPPSAQAPKAIPGYAAPESPDQGPMSPGDIPASPPSAQAPKPIPSASVIPEYAEEGPVSPLDTPPSLPSSQAPKAIPSDAAPESPDQGPMSPGDTPASPPSAETPKPIPSASVIPECIDEGPMSPGDTPVSPPSAETPKLIPSASVISECIDEGPMSPGDTPASPPSAESPKPIPSASVIPECIGEGPMSPGDTPASPPSAQAPKPIPSASVIPEYAEEGPMSPVDTPPSLPSSQAPKAIPSDAAPDSPEQGPMSPRDTPASPLSAQTPKPIPSASMMSECIDEGPMSPGETPSSPPRPQAPKPIPSDAAPESPSQGPMSPAEAPASPSCGQAPKPIPSNTLVPEYPSSPSSGPSSPDGATSPLMTTCVMEATSTASLSAIPLDPVDTEGSVTSNMSGTSLFSSVVSGRTVPMNDSCTREGKPGGNQPDGQESRGLEDLSSYAGDDSSDSVTATGSGGNRISVDTRDSGERVVLTPADPPPSQEAVRESCTAYNVPEEAHQDAYCSKPGDLPERPR